MRLLLATLAMTVVMPATLGASGDSAIVACGADVCIGDSWQSKYASAAPGTVLTVQAGTHQAQSFSRIASKMGPPVVFKPVAGAVTVAGGITSGRAGGSVTSATGAAHIELRDMTVQGEVTLRWGSDDWTLRNITARNIRLQSVSDVRVLGGSYGPYLDQVATINTAGGTSPGVSNILIDGAKFHDYTISDPAKHAECMQIWPSAPSSDVTIRNTSFRNCTDFGVLVKTPKLTGMVFERVTLDEPQTGNVATVGCNPNCPRSGSSIRFSTYAYPGARVTDSRMAGSLAIDVSGYVAVSGGCTKCDPDGGVPPPPTCPGSTLPLTKTTETETTITFSWAPVANVFAYFFTSTAQGARWSHTLDGTRTTVRFAKGSACYRVVAVGVIADGGTSG